MSEVKGRYRAASDDVACEEFDGEMVVLNLASGHYFALNKSASFVMQGLLSGHAAEILASMNTAAFSAEEVSEFVADLVSNELVAVDESNEPVPINAELIAQANNLSEKPQLEVHDDLADLIIADPIHDTDEAVGWPAPQDKAA